MFNMLLKLIKALNSHASPWQLSFALAFGMIVGLSPFYSLHNLAVLLLVFLFRINISAFFLSVAFFTGIAYIIDVKAIELGEYFLTHPEYQELWTGLYQSSFWQLTHFNHTLTLGSLLIALAFFLPMLFVSKLLIELYRHRFMVWFGRLRLVEMLKANKAYMLYQTLSD